MLLSLLLMAGTTYVLRDTIATAMFASFAAVAPGITCSRPKIDVDRSFTRIELEPFECTIERGPLQRLRADSATRIELHGLRTPRISIAQARIDWRERDVSHVETNMLGDIGQTFGATDPLFKAILDAAELYDAHAPELEIEKLSAFRAGKRENVQYGFRQQLDGEWSRTRARRVEAAAGPVELRDLDMRVMPSRCQLAVSIYLGTAERGEQPDAKLTVSGRGLDQPKPKFELVLHSPGDQRTASAKNTSASASAR
ncbi:MAG TPA: hypothetical protein VJV78_31620 [Polyangiales bacterium]|nr:hypothetical protein [Polyangiales bacterium]